jgi:hypothetical protein
MEDAAFSLLSIDRRFWPVSSPVAPGARLPFVVVLLTIGTFLMCTSEYLVAGLLPQLSAGLRVSVAQAGLLITAFAAGMIAGGPVMAVATARLLLRAVLVLALAIFAAGHVLAALSSDFTLVLAARVGLAGRVLGAGRRGRRGHRAVRPRRRPARSHLRRVAAGRAAQQAALAAAGRHRLCHRRLHGHLQLYLAAADRGQRAARQRGAAGPGRLRHRRPGGHERRRAPR